MYRKKKRTDGKFEVGKINFDTKEPSKSTEVTFEGSFASGQLYAFNLFRSHGSYNFSSLGADPSVLYMYISFHVLATLSYNGL